MKGVVKLNFAWRIVLASALASGVLLVSQTKIGPWVGLRLPVYDYSCRCYRFLKMSSEQFRIDPDSAGTSDGILTQVTGAGASQAYTFGRGFVTFAVAGKPTQVEVDTAYMMYRSGSYGDPPPVIGSACVNAGTGGLWIGREGLRVCVPNEQRTGFVWAGAVLQTQP